jgi:hypothetical protein
MRYAASRARFAQRDLFFDVIFPNVILQRYDFHATLIVKNCSREGFIPSWYLYFRAQMEPARLIPCLGENAEEVESLQRKWPGLESALAIG